MKKMCLLAILLLSACHPRMTPEQQISFDHDACHAMGFESKKDIANCILSLQEHRQSIEVQQQQAGAMNTQSSAALMNASAAMLNAGRPTSTQSTGFNCTTRQLGTFGNINCY